MKHNRLYYPLVRRLAMRQLMDQGKSRSEARRLTNRVTTDEVDRESAKAKVGKVGGPFTDWIVENQAAILTVVKAIVTILLMFAAKEEKANATGANRTRVVADSDDE